MIAIGTLCVKICRKLQAVMAVVACLLSASLLYAQPDSQNRGGNTLLIINSYNENSPWAKAMITPITYHVAQNDSLHIEISYLNASLITDSLAYDKAKANALKPYNDERIDYVVYIGNPAFTLRDEVKERWGDIPMLLITRDIYDAPDNYYFSGFNQPIIDKSFPTMAELTSQFNFTTIYVPDLYKETIDMMVNLIPDMDELVFFSDAIYFNRLLSWDIENYLIAEYPEIKFRWVKASSGNNEEFRYYITNRLPKKGLLLSSWLYEQINALGYPEVVSGDINLLFSSINPVFSLRESYMPMGAVGGVYSSRESLIEVINSDIDAMLNNESMRDIKTYTNRDPRIATINYPLFKEYKLDFSRLPDNVVFVDKPLTFWEKYHWQMIIALILLGVIFLIIARHNASQRHKIETLSRHQQFVDNMPIPYTKARVIYNENMSAILNVKYVMTNQAFEDIIRENSDPKNSYLLFSSEFIADKTAEMIESGKPVSFMHRFEKSGKCYIFTLCLVDSKRKRDRDIVDNIDIFAIDITKNQKTEDDLKLITKRLGTTIDVADLIPWEWNMQSDVLIFDAQSLFQRIKRSSDPNALEQERSEMNVGDFMKIVHKDDREVIRSIREKLFLDKVEKFEAQYRIIVARQNQEVEEWIEIKGAVTNRDENGRPALVMGTMAVITDRKRQEAEVIENERKRMEAEKFKDRFMTDISHELRSKLNDIVGFATLMSESDDIDKRHEYADIIEKNNQGLLDYIDNLAGEKSVPQPLYSDDDVKTPKAETSPTQPIQAPIQQAKPKDELKGKETMIVAREKTVVNAEDHAEQLAKAGKRPVILIAEDIEGNYLLLKHFIPKQYELHHAWTGQEAVDMFHSIHPDMVMMDIGMPVMDGYKATSEIRKFNTEVPIVAVTAYTFASERDLIMKSGFDDYISKPVSREAIHDALARYL